MDFEVLDRSGSDDHVICIAMVIVGDACGGWFSGLVCGSISSISDRQLSREGFHEDCEEEGRKCVSLEGASVDRERGGFSVDGHVVCVGGGV